PRLLAGRWPAGTSRSRSSVSRCKAKPRLPTVPKSSISSLPPSTSTSAMASSVSTAVSLRVSASVSTSRSAWSLVAIASSPTLPKRGRKN
ncbi:hypothetical protein EV182_005924, partial [Spiromyces aspiralis]